MIEVMQWLGKVIAVACLVGLAWTLYTGWRRRQLDIDYLWISGVAVSGVVIQWTSGIALWLAYAFWFVFVIIFATSMTMQSRARKRRQAEINAEILRRIEEGNDGTWELAPSMTLTIETRIVESLPVEGDTDERH